MASPLLFGTDEMITSMAEMPKPECESGYPISQLEQVFDAQQMARFMVWMDGQTMSICEGRRYSYEHKKYFATNCGPHGTVAYVHDVERFLRAGQVID